MTAFRALRQPDGPESMIADYPERKGIAAMPLFVSPVNCEAVVGMKPREFREFIRAEGLTIIERGKNRLVRLNDLVERLEAKTKRPATTETNRDRLLRIAGLAGR